MGARARALDYYLFAAAVSRGNVRRARGTTRRLGSCSRISRTDTTNSCYSPCRFRPCSHHPRRHLRHSSNHHPCRHLRHSSNHHHPRRCSPLPLFCTPPPPASLLVKPRSLFAPRLAPPLTPPLTPPLAPPLAAERARVEVRAAAAVLPSTPPSSRLRPRDPTSMPTSSAALHPRHSISRSEVRPRLGR